MTYTSASCNVAVVMNERSCDYWLPMLPTLSMLIGGLRVGMSFTIAVAPLVFQNTGMQQRL